MSPKHGHPLLSYQPLKTAFQLVYVTSIIARLPMWLTLACVPHLRPHPQWTFKQTLMTRSVYALIEMASRIGITETLVAVESKKDPHFQVVGPFDAHFYKGPLTAEPIKPAAVGGTWYPAKPKAEISSSQNVALYFHGGAFVQGDSKQDFCGFPAKILLEHGNIDAVFSVQYRLSGHSGLNPFPAAIQDTLTGYLFLLTTLRIPAHQIVLVGDSAGGNLVITLLRYIQEYGSELNLPPPKCCVLFSPWTAPCDVEVSKSPNFTYDWLPPVFLAWGAHSYGSSLRNPETHRYITPLGNPFTTNTPIFVNYGALEVFDYPIVQWAQQMREKGNSVEVNCETGAPHDTMLLGGLLGFEESAKKVAQKVGAFITKI
ncbi:alpha/beta hydrolase fold-3 domain-containing protein [Xylariaceae sp. FL1272]|nr:alpha/beta hydrolase fold-3 domain-containing protein [Xylariaceae sp. FL1272]